MKKIISSFLATTLVYLMFVSCETQNNGNPPELPPLASMQTDFGKMADTKSAIVNDKSANAETTVNFKYAKDNVGVFSFILAITLAVPVTTFVNSFNQEPEFIGDATWQWSSDYDVFGGVYHARLTGQVRSSDVKWEMHVSRTGVGAFDEFIWYDGTSLLDGSGGDWLLKHSQLYQEPMLQINWVRTGEEVGWIKYENVRELNDNRLANVYYGSYIEASLSDEAMNASYNIHVYDIWTIQDFADVKIEWSTTEYYGHVKSPLKFGDNDWHCWDNDGYDVDCDSI
jgi:hypothetical protein